MKRKIKITYTKILRTKVTQRKSACRVFCQLCQDWTNPVTFVEALEQFNINEQTLHRLVEHRKIHLVDSQLICRNSLEQIDWQKEFEMFSPFRH